MRYLLNETDFHFETIWFTLLSGQGGLSPTSPVVLEKPESLNTVTFSEDSV